MKKTIIFHDSYILMERSVTVLITELMQRF